MTLRTLYPMDGDPARGVGYGLLISAVCWLVLYVGLIGITRLIAWVAEVWR